MPPIRRRDLQSKGEEKTMNQYYFYTEGLTVGYHGVPLVKEIGIGLKQGEIVTLIGPNGAVSYTHLTLPTIA